MRQPAPSSLKPPCKFGAKNKVMMTSIFLQSCSFYQYEKTDAEFYYKPKCEILKIWFDVDIPPLNVRRLPKLVHLQQLAR